MQIKKKPVLILLVVLTLFALTMAACQADTPPVDVPDTPDEPAATDAPVADDPVADEPMDPKIVTIAWTQEPDSLNPWYTNMWYAAGLMDLYLCGAWSWDDTNNAFPLLVTEIPSGDNGGLSADGLTITLSLVENATWSDGTPITSADFLFTYDMIMDDANVVDSKYPYDYIVGLEAPDDYTVVMTFDEPFAPWLPNFWGYILPKHVLDPVYQSDGSIENAAWNLAPTVGCGPFLFDEWESGSFISFAKNDNHWGAVPKLDKLVFQFVPDDAAQTAAALAGDVDIAYWPPYEDIPAFRDAGLDVVPQASGYNEGWYFNLREDTASPGILDYTVRKALVMGLDRVSNTDIRLNVVKRAETFWDAIPAFVSPDIVPIEYDPTGAAQLLEDAGYTDSDSDGIREDLNGNPLVITQCNTTKEERVSYQAVAQQQMLAIGIDLQTRAIDADLFFESYANAGPAAIGECDIMQWSDAPAFPDPDTSYWLCSEMVSDDYPYGYNYFTCDEDLDALFQKQLVTVNAAERTAIFHEITKHMHDNLYFIGIWEDPDVWILNPNITGIKFSGVAVFYQVAEWDLTQ